MEAPSDDREQMPVEAHPLTAGERASIYKHLKAGTKLTNDEKTLLDSTIARKVVTPRYATAWLSVSIRRRGPK